MAIPSFLKEHARVVQRFFPGLRNKFAVQNNRGFRYERGDRNAWELEDEITVAGKRLPIFKHYRHAVKPGWKYYGPLSALNDLGNKGLLAVEDKAFLKKAVGHRTLTVPLEEVRSVLDKYLQKHADLFLTLDIPPLAKRLLKPSLAETNKLIESWVTRHKQLVYGLKARGVDMRQRKFKVLEIGYTSGGESINALERLGFEAHGIDYFFNASVKQTLRHEFIKNLVGSNVQFHVGDMTKQTKFDDQTFDLIISNSVIEHILDLDGGFREMHRILKNDGVMVHGYGAYQFHAGAHSPGIPDSPWAHVRLSEEDYFEYIRQTRPYEADIAVEWMKNSLVPDNTISKVQKSLLQAGFSIEMWNNTPIGRKWINDLDGEILADALNTIPCCTIEDLVTAESVFVGKK
jgi:SAM-dependent methyltransferase